MKINFEHRGGFSHMERFLTKSLHIKALVRPILDKYGRRGVELLKQATPKDSGKTADSWKYDIVKDDRGQWQIVWSNTNVVGGANVAILLQYGHATRNGGFVKGNDFINPAIEKVFQGMANEAWEEVKQHGTNG